jgi:hypothetical protein
VVYFSLLLFVRIEHNVKIYNTLHYPDQKRTLPVLKTMKSRGMTTPALLQCILC